MAGAAQAARVLRPGGRLAVFWNSFLLPPGLGEAFAEAYRRVLPDGPMAPRGFPGPDMYALMCDKAADGMRQAGRFSEPEQWRFDWERLYTRDEWLDVLPTFGGGHGLPPDTLRELLAGMGAAVDAVGGSFTMGYATMVSTSTR